MSVDVVPHPETASAPVRPTPWRPKLAWLADLAPEHRVQLLTLLTLGFYSAGARTLIPLVAAGVLLPAWRGRAWFWAVATALVGVHLLSGWYQMDNHQWLIGYWCLALTLATGAPNATEILRQSARMLIGLAFALAVVQKLLRPEFRDGAFWVVAFVADGRLATVFQALVDGSPTELAVLRQHLRGAMDGSGPLFVMSREIPNSLLWFGRAMSVWTLAIEASVAVAFLAPWAKVFRVRNVLLLGFLLSTYPLAPVTGFGWILTTLGLAQARPEERRATAAYLAVSVILPAFVLLRQLLE